VFGLIFLADFCARFFISRHRLRDLLNPLTWADAVAIVSFLAPLAGEAAGFLRILRTLRLLRSYQLLARLRADSNTFRRHEDIIIACANFAVFLFVTTGFIYETQHAHNPGIHNYVDALYFTVAALTAGHAGPADLHHHHDLRGDAVFRAGARGSRPRQGALPMSKVRIAAARSRRRALQGLRRGVEYTG
jgi:voltage-gated potassium channel